MDVCVCSGTSVSFVPRKASFAEAACLEPLPQALPPAFRSPALPSTPSLCDSHETGEFWGLLGRGCTFWRRPLKKWAESCLFEVFSVSQTSEKCHTV